MRAQEGPQEGVQVVGRSGEVEPGRVEGPRELAVEGGHAGRRFGVGDEGCAQDADGGEGLGDFDGVVNVLIDVSVAAQEGGRVRCTGWYERVLGREKGIHEKNLEEAYPISQPIPQARQSAQHLAHAA